jgi:hypothetical protein
MKPRGGKEATRVQREVTEMPARVYTTTVLARDESIGLAVISLPAATRTLVSKKAIEEAIGVSLEPWEPLLPANSKLPGTRYEVMLRDVFANEMTASELASLLEEVTTHPLLPTEASDPVFASLATLGGGATAAAALLYGVGAMGPIAVIAIPAGVFLWFVARPAGEGVGSWLKRTLDADSRGRSERRV